MQQFPDLWQVKERQKLRQWFAYSAPHNKDVDVLKRHVSFLQIVVFNGQVNLQQSFY
jgi:hypothetical protein